MIDRNLFLSSDGISFDGKRAVPSEEVTKLMLSLVDLQPGEKVLEIGTGSGYQTAAILESGVNLATIDCESHLFPLDAQFAIMACGGPQELWQKWGDGKEGVPLHAPYDAIIVSCGMTSIPLAYEEQLREGGRLVIPLGKPDGQELLRLEKRNGKLAMGRCAGYVRFQMAS